MLSFGNCFRQRQWCSSRCRSGQRCRHRSRRVPLRRRVTGQPDLCNFSLYDVKDPNALGQHPMELINAVAFAEAVFPGHFIFRQPGRVPNNGYEFTRSKQLQNLVTDLLPAFPACPEPFDLNPRDKDCTGSVTPESVSWSQQGSARIPDTSEISPVFKRISTQLLANAEGDRVSCIMMLPKLMGCRWSGVQGFSRLPAILQPASGWWHHRFRNSAAPVR